MFARRSSWAFDTQFASLIMAEANNEADAIWQAMTAMGGERSIQEVTAWIERHYPQRWKDVGTPMADLTFPGNNSSGYSPERRFLERTAPGRYRIRQSGAFTVGI